MIQALRTFLLILILVGLTLIFTRNYWVPTVVDYILDITGQAKSISYTCAQGKTVTANYYEGAKSQLTPTKNSPPQPTGVASFRLDGEQEIYLTQTLSADGVRYANPEESLIFWSKGDGLLILENGKEGAYTNCVRSS